MRKYIIGFIVGSALTFAMQAGAATLIGSTIDAVIQVEVDGENLGQAPVIDGTSYLPVRKLGGKAGYDVTFGEGKAILTSNDSVPVESQAPATAEPVIEKTIEQQIKEINQQIKVTNNKLFDFIVLHGVGKPYSPEDQKTADEYNAKILELEKQKSALEAQQ